MFLQLSHTRLDVYHSACELLKECYRITKYLPSEERFILTHQIRKAALSVVLNIAEGASRKSLNEKKRFYEISRGSVIEIDAAVGIIRDLNYLNPDMMKTLGIWLNKCFSMLSRMTAS